jgi:hypothetical protein
VVLKVSLSNDFTASIVWELPVTVNKTIARNEMSVFIINRCMVKNTPKVLKRKSNGRLISNEYLDFGMVQAYQREISNPISIISYFLPGF